MKRGEKFLKLIKNRFFIHKVIYVLVLIAFGVFATYYGEKMPKLIFFVMLILPFISYLYTFLIFMRFRIWQEVPSIKVEKNQIVPYRFSISNEDIYSYSDIKVNFLKDYSKIGDNEIETDYLLLPKTRKNSEGTICAKYRGTYYVGVDSVEITDFMRLFHIKYPFDSKLKIIVWPKVVELKQSGFLDQVIDQKNMRTAQLGDSEILDLDLRKYIPGDNKKMIHWKASAKKRELMTRKNTGFEEMQTMLYMDLTPVLNEENKIAAEDKIVELSIAIAKYFLVKQEAFQIMYDSSGMKYEKRTVYMKTSTNQSRIEKMKNYPISNQREFSYFYQDCVYCTFVSEQKISDVALKLREKMICGIYFIAISSHFDDEIHDTLLSLHKQGFYVTYFYIQAAENERTENLMKDAAMQGVMIKTIHLDDKIESL